MKIYCIHKHTTSLCKFKCYNTYLKGYLKFVLHLFSVYELSVSMQQPAMEITGQLAGISSLHYVVPEFSSISNSS